MCSLPAGFPWPHLLPAAKTHTTDTRPHPHTGNPQGPPALTGRCQRPPRSPGLAGLSPGLGTTGMAPLPGFCKCEVQSYSPAENGANTRGSPGRRRSCPSSKSSHTHSQKGPRKSNFSVLQPGYVPEALREASVQRGPLLDIWGLYLAPDLLSRGQRVPPAPRAGSSHAAAGRDLAAIPEPGHLRPGEAGDAWGADDGGLSVGDSLVLLALLEAPHVCGGRSRCRRQGPGRRQRLPGSWGGNGGSRGKMQKDDHGAGAHHTQTAPRDSAASCFWGLQFAFIGTHISMKQRIHPVAMEVGYYFTRFKKERLPHGLREGP